MWKTDSYGTTGYAYDKTGRVTKVIAPGKTTVYPYDKAGNRVPQNETYTSPQPSDYVDEATGKSMQYIEIEQLHIFQLKHAHKVSRKNV